MLADYLFPTHSKTSDPMVDRSRLESQKACNLGRPGGAAIRDANRKLDGPAAQTHVCKMRSHVHSSSVSSFNIDAFDRRAGEFGNLADTRLNIRLGRIAQIKPIPSKHGARPLAGLEVSSTGDLNTSWHMAANFAKHGIAIDWPSKLYDY